MLKNESIKGKPFTIAYGGDVVSCVSTLRYYAGWADKFTGKGKKTGNLVKNPEFLTN